MKTDLPIEKDASHASALIRGSASGKWPMAIDVRGYPPPKLTQPMRETLRLMRVAYVEIRGPYPRWEAPVKSGSRGWKHPRRETLAALCRRGLVQFVPRAWKDSDGFWRISATGRRFLLSQNIAGEP